MTSLRVAVICCLASLAACSLEPRQATLLEVDAGAPCTGLAPRTLDVVYTQHLSSSAPTGCATSNCHGTATGAGGLMFDSASEFRAVTMGVRSKNDPGMLLVAPGDPDRSYLYRKLLAGASNRMPEGGPYLGAAGLADVAGWICDGAKPATSDGGTPGGSPLFDLASVTPSSVVTGSAMVTLTLDGIGFLSTSIAKLDGATLPTGYVSATRLTAMIDASITSTAATHAILVANATATTSTKTFTVQNPVPTLSALNPSQTATNGAPFTLTLTGANFNASSRVTFDGNQVVSTFVSATTLSITVPTLTAARNYPVFVTNPAPGGGTSATLNLVASVVTGPTISGLAPSPALANTVFSLTVSGSGYECTAPASVVTVGSSSLSHTSCSTTQLAADVPALAAGNYAVQVTNPSTNNASNPASLSIVAPNPTPALSSSSPSSACSGAGGFTLVATGTSFVSGARLFFGGAERATTFLGATQVSAAIPTSDLTSAGTYPITVSNPSPGGGTSNAVNFAVVQSHPTPVIATLTPCGRVANATAFTLSINGSSFAIDATVTFGGTAVTVTSQSSTQLQVSIPGSLVTTAPADDVVPVVVTNPGACGGGSSGPAYFGLASAVSMLSGGVQTILTSSCATAGCHTRSSPTIPMSLASGETYGSTVGVISSQCAPRLRIQACGPLPSQSYFMAKILNTDICFGTRMPKAAPLSTAEIKIIRDWIAQGAPP
jgi:hypothetical protein